MCVCARGMCHVCRCQVQVFASIVFQWADTHCHRKRSPPFESIIYL